MKKFNFKEAGTWAGLGVVLGTVAGTLNQFGMVQPAAVVAALAAVCGAVAGYLPENKVNGIK